MFYKETNLTLGSLFDGIGGFPHAASFYGIRPLWASEIIPECVSVTKRHFPDMIHVGDITKLHGGELPPVDIITFGSPCQGLSLAGLRRGLADERSGLFLEAIRIIFEMREATNGKYPRFAVFENVPGALSSAGGRDYQVVLQSFTKAEISVPRSGKWANAGMVRSGGTDLAWVVYDSQHFGTAQRRRRLFLVCDFGGKRAGEILFVPKSLRGYFEAGGTPRQGLTAFAESGADEPGRLVEVLNGQGCWSPVETVQHRPSRQARPGDSITVERFGLSPTLRSQTHGNLPIVAACEPCVVGINGNLAGTLDASYCKGTGMRCGIERDVVLCAATEQGHAEVTGQPSRALKAYSIGAYYSKGMLSDNPAVGFSEADISRTLDQNGGNPSCQQGGIAVVGGNLRDRVLIARRLMPIEAERLMGFPDSWTQQGHDGRLISDSKRYSMLGNSISVPCVAYIMQGIRDALLREEN